MVDEEIICSLIWVVDAKKLIKGEIDGECHATEVTNSRFTEVSYAKEFFAEVVPPIFNGWLCCLVFTIAVATYC